MRLTICNQWTMNGLYFLALNSCLKLQTSDDNFYSKRSKEGMVWLED